MTAKWAKNRLMKVVAIVGLAFGVAVWRTKAPKSTLVFQKVLSFLIYWKKLLLKISYTNLLMYQFSASIVYTIM